MLNRYRVVYGKATYETYDSPAFFRLVENMLRAAIPDAKKSEKNLLVTITLEGKGYGRPCDNCGLSEGMHKSLGGSVLCKKCADDLGLVYKREE